MPFVAAAMALAGCSAVELPPPVAPAAEMPAVAMPTDPPTPGLVRVVLDTPADHARIERLSGTQKTVDSDGNPYVVPVWTPICSTTPCVFDFQRGRELLRTFSLDSPLRKSALEFEVGQPVVVRHVLDETTHRHRAPWIVTLAAGSAAGVAGLIVSPIGASTHDRAVVDAGLACAGTGAALLVTSFVLMSTQRGEHRPSATTILPLRF